MGLIRCTTADPPWLERGAGQVKRGADRHYPLMPKEQILQVMADAMGLVWWSGMPRADCKVATDSGSHLWIWVTDTFLADGLWIMGQLGWIYKRTMVWVKMRDGLTVEDASTLDVARESLQIGLGQYMRGSHELCLLGVRGESHVPPPENRVPSVIFAERGKHSAKPEEAFQVFETVSPGPYYEIFARSQRPGWKAYGNEL